MGKFFLCAAQHRKSLHRGSIASFRTKYNGTLWFNWEVCSQTFWICWYILSSKLAALSYLIGDALLSDGMEFILQVSKSILNLFIRFLASATNRRIFKRSLQQKIHQKISSLLLWWNVYREDEWCIKCICSYAPSTWRKELKFWVFL